MQLVKQTPKQVISYRNDNASEQREGFGRAVIDVVSASCPKLR
jgi:hypothetical protein